MQNRSKVNQKRQGLISIDESRQVPFVDESCFLLGLTNHASLFIQFMIGGMYELPGIPNRTYLRTSPADSLSS